MFIVKFQKIIFIKIYCEAVKKIYTKKFAFQVALKKMKFIVLLLFILFSYLVEWRN